MEEKEENLNFETAMKQLEEIANQLEKNDLDLDKAVEKFEEGMKLSKKCSEILENAEKKIATAQDGIMKVVNSVLGE